MKNFLFAYVLLVFCFLAAVPGQERAVENKFELTGVVKDKNSVVFAGASLFFNNNGETMVFSTDSDGKFTAKLSPGTYKVRVNKIVSESFMATVVVGQTGSKKVEFIVEPNAFCCGSAENPYPKLVNFPKPDYPAAARAILASGEVIVEVKIDQSGKVTSARAVGGHPLLRSASQKSAAQALFEPSENAAERQATLTYAFMLPSSKKNKKEPRRYSNPYRLEIGAPAVSIDY